MTTDSIDRLEVIKTYKLYIDGKFPRSESGRTLVVRDSAGDVEAHVSHASRKDLRDAVSAARKALDGWRSSTPYLRGQILYRIAEMMEGKKEELAEALKNEPAAQATATTPNSRSSQRSSARRSPKAIALARGGASGSFAEVEASIDRFVAFAGWADKYAQVLGCNNPVAGPYYNFTVPEPTGVIAVVAPDGPALLGLVSLLAPVVCSGNTAVVLTGESDAARLAGVILGEVMATSDVPAGAINLLTGTRTELLPIIAGHRDIDGVHAAGLNADESRTLREGVAENLKRVLVRGEASTRQTAKAPKPKRTAESREESLDFFDADACTSPWWIEPFVEMKTIWHPSAV